MPGNGNAATFGALVLAGHTPDGRLRGIGSVGTGFTVDARRAIRAALDQIRREACPLDEPPPAIVGRSVWWVDPVIVAEVEYREFAGVLRHPSFRGIRTDKAPEQVKVSL
ncbi:ATP dependent DNA ligase [Nocardia stercoris]|uniref:DNA ligase (ATP) n=1 Tax=Nocardia stercoris TaxID=2483361 RepID=A0A3M2KX06_9NOCA|nr:hypothetical protein [Nocardia stercoris]RMI28035.1 hypothetical protein EBN03_31715 [Nocardia stercoris]